MDRFVAKSSELQTNDDLFIIECMVKFFKIQHNARNLHSQQPANYGLTLIKF